MALFTTRAFDETIHLTNVEVNEKNPDYKLRYSMQTGHKWSFNKLWEHLKTKDGTDHEPIWEKIKDIALKTIISGEPDMFEGVQTYLLSKYSGHELFGFDILLDKNLKPWVLEVNVAPGIQGHSGNPHPAFDPMCRDMLNLAGYRIPGEEDHDNDGESGPSVSPDLLLDERWWTKNLSNAEQAKHKYYSEHYEYKKVLSTILDTLTPDDIRVLVDTIDENKRRGGFDRIFPRLDTEYDQYFEKPRYHNLLVHEWIKRYHGNEEEGIALLESYCKESKHLSGY
ncbi:tubulin polyglutamylase TTLL4-like [Lingula anatina]|uniref:Tubulin polyglutamylase TTLL4-like n=1 Tax=Lingula anatina TaxID=7574 RepID=A0A1S3HDE6_LINAN|nr:tubulin polyglutamylase TTLL4-like [Lingula anatina]|eukprot:XP_013384058.1 tubulin polyglutamylase TTLL4-like [Lingula anatina]